MTATLRDAIAKVLNDENCDEWVRDDWALAESVERAVRAVFTAAEPARVQAMENEMHVDPERSWEGLLRAADRVVWGDSAP